MSRVTWIEPPIVRGVVQWNTRCEADIESEEAREYRHRLNKPTRCDLFAKIDYAGAKLCVRHAQRRALTELIEATRVGVES